MIPIASTIHFVKVNPSNMISYQSRQYSVPAKYQGKRYEKRSTIFTTNVNFRQWDEIFQAAKLANAILDRIIHYATVVTIVGDSYRLKDHFAKENE